MSLNLDDNKRPYSPNLGLNEVFDEIQASVNALETAVSNIPTGYTEAIINVSSAQILTMGDTPVEILPAPGAGKYYDIDWKSSFIEFTAGTSSYNTGTIDRVVFNYTDGYSSNMVTGDFLAESDNVIVPMLANMIWSTSSNVVIMGYTFLNTGLILQSFDASSNTENPTLGNGTMRIKVYYKEITFGA